MRPVIYVNPYLSTEGRIGRLTPKLYRPAVGGTQRG